MRKTYLTLSACLLFAVVAQGQTELQTEILNTWKKHTEMTALLAKGIDEAYLADQSASGGRTVGEQLAHMHNVRLMWVGGMLEGQQQKPDDEIDADESKSHAYLMKQLASSDELIGSLLKNALADDTKFGEMSAVRFMGYLIAHEAHTRGQIILAMKQSGHALPPQVTYGIWQW